ncbi:MAG TPA: hypothetical protein VD794_03545 [Flavisolibacter sp.]|nr:hypothetical protein [Flavisolibacter sp.]
MNTKLLGALGMIGAPFFLLAFIPGTPWYAQEQDTSLQGLFCLIYMLGWMCSILGLMQLRATGTSRWGRFVLIMELVFLSLANCWNTWNILQIDTDSSLYLMLDLTWPLSNAWMLVIAITIIVTNKLTSWRRWIPLIVALWLPFGLSMVLGIGRNNTTLLLPGIYSAIAWFLLGYMVWSAPTNTKDKLLALG